MLDFAIAIWIAHMANQDRWEAKLKEEARITDIAPSAIPEQLRPLLHLLPVTFSGLVAWNAYRCNANSLTAGFVAFLFPVVYMIVHAMHWFKCDTVTRRLIQKLDELIAKWKA